MIRAVAGFAAIALLVAACSGGPTVTQPPAEVANTLPPEDAAGSEAPPEGEIWFGTGFDPVTYATEGRLRSAPISQEVAVVAHFDRIVDSNMTLQILHGDEVRYKEVIPLDFPIDLYGVLVPFDTILIPGSYTVRFRDVGGHTVASGTLKLTK